MKGFLILAMVLLGLCFASARAGMLAAHAEQVDPIETVIVRSVPQIEYRTAPRSKEFWYKLIDQFAYEFDIPPLLLRTIFIIESSEAENTYAFNKHKLKRAAKVSGDPLEQKMLASALCPFQVLGLTAEELHVPWEDVAFSPVECVRTAAYFVRKLLDRHSRDSKREQLRLVLRDYYGRDANGELYARKGMAILASMDSARHRS